MQPDTCPPPALTPLLRDRCSLPSTDLERLYNEGKHCEADESLGLVLFTRDELFSEQRAVFRVPDLSELDVEYPWARTCPGDPAAAVAAGEGGENGPGDVRSDVVPGEAAVTAASCTQSGVAAVNCDASAASEQVINCEPADVAAESQANEVHSREPEGSEVDSKAAAPTTASKPRQQPPKKRRRNRKDKRGAGRAEPTQPEKKEDDPVPAPVNELADCPTKDAAASVPDSQSVAYPEAPGDPAAQSSTAITKTASADCQSVQQNPGGDSPKYDAKDQPAPASGLPETSNEASAAAEESKTTSAEAETPSGVAALRTTAEEAPSSSAAACDSSEPAAGASDEVVVVQQNGVVLLRSGGEVIETTLPAANASGDQIETHAEVVNNPEGTEPAGDAELTAEQLERQRKAALWQQMTPGCKAALILLKAANLKGFVFRF